MKGREREIYIVTSESTVSNKKIVGTNYSPWKIRNNITAIISQEM